MSVKTRPAQTLSDPQGIDRVILAINANLRNKLSWLENTYGKCEKLMEEEDGKQFSYPAIYAGGNEYIEMFPDESLGNFSFFDIIDRGELNTNASQTTEELYFGIVLWFDYRKVYPVDHETKSVENVKWDVLNVLKTTGVIGASLKIEKVLERIENIYNGYNLAQYRGYHYKRIKSPFMMRPYGVIRIEGTIKYQNIC